MNSIKDFILDYCMRHAHPVNAILHIVGVPAVFIGLYLLFSRQPILGWTLFAFGYFLQYLGHRAQGNEVGEVTLIKKIWVSTHRQSKRTERGEEPCGVSGGKAETASGAQTPERLSSIKERGEEPCGVSGGKAETASGAQTPERLSSIKERGEEPCGVSGGKAETASVAQTPERLKQGKR